MFRSTRRECLKSIGENEDIGRWWRLCMGFKKLFPQPIHPGRNNCTVQHTGTCKSNHCLEMGKLFLEHA